MKKENTRGQKVPSFYTKMFKDKVEELVNKGLKERQDLFLLDLKVSEGNAITVVIDGDDGVLVEDCMFISRAIEHNLDREEQDFSLEVTSAGATSPLINKRQYKKILEDFWQSRPKTIRFLKANFPTVTTKVFFWNGNLKNLNRLVRER